MATSRLDPRRSAAVLSGVLTLALVAALLAFVGSAPAAATAGDLPITGSFFVDTDSDGAIDPGEAVAGSDALFPPNGIAVTATDRAGTVAPCTVTDGTPPTYSCALDALGDGPFRVQFSLDPADETAGWTNAFLGPDSGTNIQFASAGDTLTFGVTPPSQCPSGGSDEGVLFTTCVVHGLRSSGGPQEVVVATDYDLSSGVASIGEKSNLGSVWGVAFDEWTGTLFVSAHLQRMIDLGNQGLDGLYWNTYPGATAANWSEVGLDSLGGSSFGVDPARDLGEYDELTRDPAPFAIVGKTGIGDIDVTPNGQYLAATNLSARQVAVYDIRPVRDGNNPTFVKNIPLTNPGCPDVANPSDWYPWAVKAIDGDQLLIGIVCTAENSAAGRADLRAMVVPVSISAGTAGANIASVPLGYERGCIGSFPTCGAGSGTFDPWNSDTSNFRNAAVWREQPILADIELDTDGSMILGFADRASLMHPDGGYGPEPTDDISENQSGGDIIRLCAVGGGYVIEGPGVAGCDASANFPTGSATSSTADFNGGPGGNAEWYGAERYPATGTTGHSETAQGGLYVHPFTDEVALASMDPGAFVSGGINYFDNTTGALVDELLLFLGGRPTDGNGYLGKGQGIGDIEGCWVPLEIGNYAWLDLDQDGMQDPNEQALENVTVSLRDAANNLIATTRTDANGAYSFNSFDGLEPGVDYVVQFDISSTSNVDPAMLGLLVPTRADLGGDDDLDSDASIDAGDLGSGLPEIAHRTGGNGSVDHSLDAGFVLPYDLALTEIIDPAWTPDADWLTAGTSTVDFLIEITNQAVDVAHIDITNYIDDEMWTDLDLTANPGGDVHTSSTAAAEFTFSWTATPFAPVAALTPVNPGDVFATGETLVIPLTLTVAPGVDADSTVQLVNTSEISRFDNDEDPANGDSSAAGTGSVLLDYDSFPDGTDATSAGEDADLVDNVIDQDGKIAGQDEDDHDPAYLPLYDLALIKVLSTTVSPAVDMVASPAVAAYDITVTNQGAAPAYLIDVTDYPAAGTSYSATNPATLPVADGSAVVTAAAPDSFRIDALAGGDSVTFSVLYAIDDVALEPYRNVAEVSAFDNNPDADDALPAWVVDIDSTPDGIDGNGDGESTDLVDDETDESSLTGGDEDDHDPAVFTLPYDQALAETLTSIDWVNGTATFALTVTNQGRAVETFSVVDYIDASMWRPFDAEDNTAGFTTGDVTRAYNWDASEPLAPVVTVVGGLAPGQSATIPITLSIIDDATTSAPLELENWSEISNFDDDDDPTNGNGADRTLVDIDSIPNTNIADDAQPTGPGAPGDDVTTGNGDGTDPVTGDEDDHDVAGIPLWDLALIIERSATQPLLVDPLVSPIDGSFDITVKNQGLNPAYAIAVAATLPAGMEFASLDGVIAGTAAVADDGAGPGADQQSFVVDGLDPDEEVTFTIGVTITDTASSPYIIGAEISAFDDNSSPSDVIPVWVNDIDSTPDADAGDEFVADGTIHPSDGDNDVDSTTTGEDDQDFEALVIAFDLALIKTLDLKAFPPKTWATPGTTVVTFNVEITNQGAPVQTVEITDYVQPGFRYDPTDNPDGSTVDSGDGDTFDFAWSKVAGDDAPKGSLRTDGTLAPGESILVPIKLRIAEDWDGAPLVGWSEISNFDDDDDPTNGNGADRTLVDIDSIPNTNIADDAQPTGPGAPGDDVITGNGDGTDPVTGDEDDHDVAGIPVWDLALINDLDADQPFVVDVTTDPPTAAFTLTVVNQGQLPAFGIQVADYIPEGTTYTAGTAPTMPTETSEGQPVTVTDDGAGGYSIDALAAGDSVSFGIVLDIVDLGLASVTNGAEIVSFDDNLDPSDIVPGYVVDVDSTPDAIDDDPVITDPSDPAVADDPNSPLNSHDEPWYDPDGDGNVNEPTPGDEDDHDVEFVVLPHDLALRNTVDAKATTFPVIAGTAVTFQLEVTNQGAPVRTIEITDYVQAGFEYDPSINPGGTVDDSSRDTYSYEWSAEAGATPTVAISTEGALRLGESVRVPIVLTVAETHGGQLDNWAEISNFDDDLDPTNGDASDGSLADLDSTPDGDIADDAQPGTWGDPGDDVITGNGDGTDPVTGDEDDHDVAGVPVLDNALVAVIDAAQSELPVTHGSIATFTIEVTNQGSVHSGDVEVVDYVDLEKWEPFDPALNPATLAYSWEAQGTDGLASLAAPVAPGQTVTLDVALRVAPEADLAQLWTTAEIAAATATDADGTEITYPDGSPIPDIDSTPDTVNDDPQPARPGDPTDNVTDNSAGDEDDHDIAGVEAPTFSVGDQVWLDADNDGVIDPAEDPIEGVAVWLFPVDDGAAYPDDLNGDGAVDEQDAAATTVTDGDGRYVFDELAPGDYFVGIPPAQWDADGPLAGTLPSDPTTTDANDDVDDVNDGADCGCPDGLVLAGPVTLGDGEPLDENPDGDPNRIDGNSNLTVDFGFQRPVYDLAMRMELDDSAPSVVDVGDNVTFVITLSNRGDVDGLEPTIVDHVPTGLTLADADWTTQTDGTATIELADMTIAPGEDFAVPITFRVDGSAVGGIQNLAGIADATPTRNGAPLRQPNGELIPDVDSNTDQVLIALSVAPPPSAAPSAAPNFRPTGPLAFSGSDSRLLVALGLVLVAMGGAVLVGRRRWTNR